MKINVLSSESRDKANIERKRNKCFGYAESRKTTKFIEHSASFAKPPALAGEDTQGTQSPCGEVRRTRLV
ncbi:MAG: hypothetical protein LBS01_10470 [Prevotellaceae bacterium]|nr:hypothetical protein [Prevotellaceae bacterium]